MDNIATNVAKTTVTISPKVKGSPALSFQTSSPLNFLECIVSVKKVA